MGILDWIKLIMQFFPVVIQVVTAIEAAIPGAAGAAKKVVAMAAIAPPAAQVASVGNLVDTVVTSLNAAGVFSKTSAAPPLAVVAK